MALSHDPINQKFTVHNARRVFGEDHIIDLEFIHEGKKQDFTVAATPLTADVQTGGGSGKASASP